MAKIVEESMRKVTYSVAMSLDGFIAGPNGEVDWIIMDPEIDFRAFHSRFDTVLIGRRTFEFVKTSRNVLQPGISTFVFSRTLNPHDHPDITILAKNVEETIGALRTQPGKEIWLTGGGSLFLSLAQAKLVDSVEVTIVPVLLGSGTPLISPPSEQITLTLQSHKIYRSGLIFLKYGLQT